MEAQSEHAHIALHVFAHFGADLHARSVLINKISASELRRKLIKSALLVGQGRCQHLAYPTRLLVSLCDINPYGSLMACSIAMFPSEICYILSKSRRVLLHLF